MSKSVLYKVANGRKKLRRKHRKEVAKMVRELVEALKEAKAGNVVRYDWDHADAWKDAAQDADRNAEIAEWDHTYAEIEEPWE